MKKLLLLCLMGYLCLPTSTLLAKVVDSPGADFLHRFVPRVSHGVGDSHRGGEIRSDTLPEVFDLEDHSVEKGQEGISSSACLGGMLYIELITSNPPDTLWIKIWEDLLSDSKTVSPGKEVAVLPRQGNFFEGSFNSYVYELPLSFDFKQGYFSIGRGSNTLAKHWAFDSSYRVRIRFDLRTATTVFGGPDAEFYRAQYEVDRIFTEAAFNTNPVMITDVKDGLFQDSVSKPLYQTAIAHPDDLYVKMNILVPAENSWEFLKPILDAPLDYHPAWEVLENAKPFLSEEELAHVDARIKGELLYLGMQKAELAYGVLEKEVDKSAQFTSWIAEFGLANVSGSHPRLIQAGARLTSLLARLNATTFLNQTSLFSPVLRDEIIGLYVLDNFNLLGDRLPNVLETSLNIVQTPWITEKLTTLASIQGKDLLATDFFDQDGNPVDLSDFKGKTLLIHYWISGCKFCVHDYKSVLKDLAPKYADRNDILLVSVNVDGDQESWKKGLATGDYTSPLMLNLGASTENDFIKHYRIYSFPQKMIISPDSKVILQTITRMDSASLAGKLDSIITASTNLHINAKSPQP